MDNLDIVYIASFKKAVRSVIKHGMLDNFGLCRELRKAGFEDSYYFIAGFTDNACRHLGLGGEFTDIRMTVLLILNKMDPATVLYFRDTADRG